MRSSYCRVIIRLFKVNEIKFQRNIESSPKGTAKKIGNEKLKNTNITSFNCNPMYPNQNVVVYLVLSSNDQINANKPQYEYTRAIKSTGPDS